MSNDDPLGLVGRTVADHVIEALVGEGGMASVYRARHVATGVLRAIKCVPCTSHRQREVESFEKSFDREARFLALLSNKTSKVPKFVATERIFSSRGQLVGCIVMELMSGQTLRRHIAGMPHGMPMQDAVSVLEPIVEVLGYAHRGLQAEMAGRLIVHLDLKPENIFLKGELQEPTLIDLGVARRIATDPAVDNTSTYGTLAFTMLYGAPEQFEPLRFGTPTARTDVFALALVFVELCTGKVALAGTRFADLPEDGLDVRVYRAAIDAHRRPSIAGLGGESHAAVDEVIARALAVDPEARYDDVVDFWVALCRSIQRQPLWVLSQLTDVKYGRTSTPPPARAAFVSEPPAVRTEPTPITFGPTGTSVIPAPPRGAFASVAPAESEQRAPVHGNVGGGVAGVSGGGSARSTNDEEDEDAPLPPRQPLWPWLAGMATLGFAAVATVLVATGRLSVGEGREGATSKQANARNAASPAELFSVMPIATPPSSPCPAGHTLCPELGCVADGELVAGSCPPLPGASCQGAHMVGVMRNNRCEVKWCHAGYGDCDPSMEGCETATTRDLRHCGKCGSACKIAPGSHVATQKCESSTCMLASCEPGWLNCDRSYSACSTHIDADVDNCGGCGRPCRATGASASCGAGKCSFQCKAGFACQRSDGSCRDTRSDVACCGPAAAECKAPNAHATQCDNGRCRFECDAGFACQQPNGACKDTRTDITCCGASAQECKARNAHPTRCEAGQCRFACNPGSACQQADGSCKDTNSDPSCCGREASNCAAAVDATTMTAACEAGKCVGTCKDPRMTPQAVAGGKVRCFDLASDAANCGAVGKVCTSTIAGGSVVCRAGACEQTCPSGRKACPEGKPTECKVSCDPPPALLPPASSSARPK